MRRDPECLPLNIPLQTVRSGKGFTGGEGGGFGRRRCQVPRRQHWAGPGLQGEGRLDRQTLSLSRPPHRAVWMIPHVLTFSCFEQWLCTLPCSLGLVPHTAGRCFSWTFTAPFKDGVGVGGRTEPWTQMVRELSAAELPPQTRAREACHGLEFHSDRPGPALRYAHRMGSAPVLKAASLPQPQPGL